MKLFSIFCAVAGAAMANPAAATVVITTDRIVSMSTLCCIQRSRNLGNAPETQVDRARRGLEPRQAAALRDRSAGKQRVKVFHAALMVKFFVEGVMQLAQVDEAVLVAGEELLEPAHDRPVVVAKRQLLMLRYLHRGLARP